MDASKAPEEGLRLSAAGGYDGDLSSKSEYAKEIVEEEEDDAIDDMSGVKGASHPAFAPPSVPDADKSSSSQALLKELKTSSGSGVSSNKIVDRETEYQKRRFERGVDVRGTDESYADRMKQQMEEKAEEKAAAEKPAAPPTRKRRRRWDDSGTEADASSANEAAGKVVESVLGTSTTSETPTRRRQRWDTADDEAAEKEVVVELTQEQLRRQRIEQDIARRNKPLSDAELDAMLPSEGYKIIPAPETYKPIKKKLLAAPSTTEEAETPETDVDAGVPQGELVAPDGTTLPMLKEDDMVYFGKLMKDEDESKMDKEEVKERTILRLLLRIKNGSPRDRKSALRQITANACELGAGPLFNQILPLLLSPTLEDQERHLLVKVIDRILFRLDDLVRPYVHKILVVIEPMLIDKDYYARVEGREIIANLAKAAGLPTMIATMRPDVDHVDDFVRNTTARAFAVVASALGIPTILPFIKAVSQSRKSWQARHTGIKIVQQISILVGCAVLPHLTNLVEIIKHGLNDTQQKVRLQTALTLASLAESAHPYGIDSFDSVLEPLWRGIRQHHGKVLASFLKAIGFIIPLMDDDEYASYFTKQVMAILVREFHSQDEEMRKIVLKVVQQCVSTEGVKAEYIRKEVVPEFFRSFWIRRTAMDRRNSKQLVETTVEIANRIGAADAIDRIVNDLKDEHEPYRRMVMDAITKVLTLLGANDIGIDLEQRMVDGALFAFQEQGAAAIAAAAAAALADSSGLTGGDRLNVQRETEAILNGFGVIVNSLGIRAKPYLPQICGTIKFRLHNKDAKVRMQAADLVARIAGVMKVCDEEQLMAHIGVVLYEYLGEEYPEVLGSILSALTGIVNVIGMNAMTPPIKDLLPRLTPILKNRHEKVQENCIALVGRIADRGSEFVSAREWLRICFELIEMLHAKRKSIRRAATSTFGYIAKSVGPSDVLHILLNNLKVQDRTMRVCTTVSIGVVSSVCGPFTVLPALLNEYRVCDINVQNGILKTLSFIFEYIGEMAKDYIYSVVTLLEDALTERDPVHRQTACHAVKHLALGVQGQGCEDALTHLLNFVWPNIFEKSPHVIGAVLGAIEGLRISLGPQVIFMYCVQGLFHPAREVREVYWKIYNNLYVYSADGMIPVLPVLEDDYVLPLDRDPSVKRLEAGEKKKQVIETMKQTDRELRNSYQRSYLDLFI